MKTIEIKFAGRPRQIGYGWGDGEDLSRRLGGLSLVEILGKLGELHPATVNTCLFVGLKGKDRGIKLDDITGLIDQHLDAGGTPSEVVGWITEAMTESGLLRVRKQSEEGAAGSPERPTP